MDLRKKVLEELKCSNCKSLCKSMKILVCGHSFCSNCLQREERPKRSRRGTERRNNSRAEISFTCAVCGRFADKYHVKNIPVERIIEILEEQTDDKQKTSLSKNAKRELLIVAKRFREANDVKISLAILRALIQECHGSELILPYVEKIRCLLQIGSLKDARNTANDVFNLVDCKDQLTFSSFPTDLFVLVTEYLEKNDFQTALVLVRCLIKLLSHYYQGQQLLDYIRPIFLLVKNFPNEISETSESHDDPRESRKFNEKFELLTEILKTAQQVIFAVPSLIKNIHIASMLYCIGEERDKINDCVNSSLVYAQAIGIIEVAVGCNSGIEIVGECLCKLGNSLEKMNHLTKAKFNFEKALQLYHNHRPNETIKIISVENDLERVKSKIDKMISIKKKSTLDSKFRKFSLLIIIAVFFICAGIFAFHNRYWLRDNSLFAIDWIIVQLKHMKYFIGSNIKPPPPAVDELSYQDDNF